MEGVKLNFAFLCDNAFFSEGNKLNIIGIFKNINTVRCPFRHPQIFIVSNIITTKKGSYKEEIKLKRKRDDSEIIRSFKFDFLAQNNSSKEWGFIGRWGNIKFEEFGEYVVQIFLNEELIGEIPLHLMPANK